MSRRRNGGENEESGRLRPVCTLKGHTNDVTSVDFSGRNLLATGSSDKTVRIYKWLPGDTFEEVAHSPLRGHRYGINCICFSPFGTKLASASTDGQTFIWDVKTGEHLVSLFVSGDGAGVRTCAFSANCSLLATGGDGEVAAVWDVATMTLIREIGGHDGTVTSVSFSPDSAVLATGTSSGDLKVWDARYGHSLPLALKVEVHDLGITSLHFSPSLGKEDTILSGKQYLLASGGQDTDLHLWVVCVGGSTTPFGGLGLAPSKTPPVGADQGRASIMPHHTFCGHTAPIMTVKFSSTGLIVASASGDKTVRLWDVVHLRALRILEGHTRYVTSCAMSEDCSLIAAGGGDRHTHVWPIGGEDTDLHLPALTASGPQSRRGMNKFPCQKFRENKRLLHWSPTEVVEWLGEVGLAEYSPNFRSHFIDGREMLALTDAVLEDKLGVDALGHRNKILRFVRKQVRESGDPASGKEDGGGDGGRGGGTSSPPAEFVCPITQELMVDPVLCADGFSYERSALSSWLSSGHRSSPMTNQILVHFLLTPNRGLRNLIRRYSEENS